MQSNRAIWKLSQEMPVLMSMEYHPGMFPAGRAVLPSRKLTKSTFLSWLFPLTYLSYAFALGMSMAWGAMSIHNDAWIDINIFNNIFLAQFALFGVMAFLVALCAMMLSSSRLRTDPSNEYASAQQVLLMWHLMRKLVQFWFYALLWSGLQFGASYCIQRSRNNTNTDNVRWLSGDNGGLAIGVAEFTTTQGVSNFVIYEVFGIGSIIVVWFIEGILLANLGEWMWRNDSPSRSKESVKHLNGILGSLVEVSSPVGPI
jgi:hypothetical protein